jgi:putative membrane-bound dehydrogenase-like protein
MIATLPFAFRARPLAVVLSLCWTFFATSPARAQDAGVLPVGADGKPLNLDFETGTLKDWTAEGKAFEGQPIKGDTVHPRRNDSKSQHQGQYWIGGFERFGDKPQGTLTSVPFKITHPWGSFLVGGGPWPETCVELVLKDKNEVFFRSSGFEEENMRRVAVDLQPHKDKEMFIRLVDKHSGHWGHINFDDFRFHTQKPNVPPPPKKLTPDVLKYAGLPPQKSAQVMTAPPGFDVTLFAGEPDVQQPIALCLDDRGRLWVAEAYSYPIRRKEGEGKDRILIFEDTDGDGKFDKRTVFMEGLNLVSGLEVGFGGVWIGAAPYLMFVPMKEGEDKPAGPPQILLDGWGYQDTHETLNSFIWGPDGWLYGCHGVFTHSNVGKPGTADKDRVKINAGVWRYHPTRHVFEVFAQGTSNPWGLDFNDYGQAFAEGCVIPHAFHIIQGGRYHRQAGNHFNPHTYDDIKTIADHLHWQGANPWAGNNSSGSLGGGHAHCGLMIYLGGAWPKEYRNQMFMGNIHGRRINMDTLSPKGSGCVASHGPDFLLANDAWARFINMRYGPDGNVYVIDWYDKQACHSGDVQIWDRSNGRIYKVSYRGTKPATGIDLRKKTNLELAELQLHQNDWYVRHARRLLQERKDSNSTEVKVALERILKEHKDDTRRLRALWAFHAIQGSGYNKATGHFIDIALADESPMVRAWAIQFATSPSDESSAELLLGIAAKDPSPVVRLYVASALQRIKHKDRWQIAEKLLVHAEDAVDHNLPLMYWYAIEPLADVDPARALALALNGKIPQLVPFMIRRLGSSGKSDTIALLMDGLGKASAGAGQVTFLTALREALKGRRQVVMPAAWPGLFEQFMKSKDRQVRDQCVALAVTFGQPDAALKILADSKSEAESRTIILTALLDAKHPQLAETMQRLLATSDGSPLRGLAIRGLAAYDDPKTPGALLAAYAGFNSEEKRDALNTLAARASFAAVLLDAVASKKIAAAEISADVVRQMRNLQNKAITARLTEVWGTVRDTPADRATQMAEVRKMLQTPPKTPPDVSLGRAIFAKTCAQCHTLYGVGGKVGPDLTGSNRANLDYLLENIIDPSAVIPKEYAATLVEMKDGRVITGILRGDTPAALTLVTANETLTLPRQEIESLMTSKVSMMPDDILSKLKETEVRALIAYLQTREQVPLVIEPRK